MRRAHTKIAIVGNGAAGAAVSSQLVKTGGLSPKDITIFDPSKDHYYQPALTLIGAGILGTDDASIRPKESYYLKRPMTEMVFPGLNFKAEAVEAFSPEENGLTTSSGEEWTYDYLVVAPGINADFERIPGMLEALDDPDHPAGSIYSPKYVYKALNKREEFEGGNAVFINPMQPIKCGGAPQKVMYVAEREWHRKGIKNHTTFVSATGVLFPPCKKYSVAMDNMRKERGIEALLAHTINRIEPERQVAIFNRNSDQEEIEVPYDYIHLVPPMKTPKAVRESTIIDAAGFVDVDQHSMQHKTFKNIYGLGDSCNAPAAKTAAAIFSQAPVVVHNIL